MSDACPHCHESGVAFDEPTVTGTGKAPRFACDTSGCPVVLYR